MQGTDGAKQHITFQAIGVAWLPIGLKEKGKANTADRNSQPVFMWAHNENLVVLSWKVVVGGKKPTVVAAGNGCGKSGKDRVAGRRLLL